MEKAKRNTYSYKNNVVRLHIKRPQSIISIPSFVCRQLNDRWDILGIDTDIIELMVDEGNIEILPAECSSNTTYVLGSNGSGAGRKVTLPLYLVDKFDLIDGYYRADVRNDGVLHVSLREKVK